MIIESRNGRRFEVERDGEAWRCSCRGFAARRRCVHVLMAEAGLGVVESLEVPRCAACGARLKDQKGSDR